MMCGQCNGICSACSLHKVIMDGTREQVFKENETTEDAGDFVAVPALFGNLKGVKKCKKSKTLFQK